MTGSIFRGSNDVKNRKFSQFSANHTELQLNASGTQTIPDRIDLQKRKDAQWNYLSLTCRQIWPQVNGLTSRGQCLPNSNTKFFSFRFSLITSDLLGLGQWFWRLCVSLVKTIRMISILTPKGQFENLACQGQVRSNWVILHIIRFGAMRQTHWCHFHSSVSSGSRVMSRNMFSP